jgi:hypothetical protein
MRLALILGVLIALGSTARAGSDVGIVVTGESWIQPQVAAQFEGWLTQHGHSVTPLPSDALNALKQCFASAPTPDLSCASGIVDKLARPSSVIYAGIDARNATSGPPDLTLTAVWFDKGHEAIGRTQTCAHCTEQSLRTTADDLLKQLVGGSDPGHVKLKSAPPGATIKIDGKAIGVAPLDWDLPPGKHTIQMNKQGLRPASKDINVISNKSDLVVLTLTSDGGDDEGGTRLPRWLPLAAVVGGGTAITTGVVLIAVDQEPSKVRTPRQYYYNTAPLGIGLTIGGVVAGGLGAYFLWFRSPKATSTPVATFTSDTAYIGWLGRF